MKKQTVKDLIRVFHYRALRAALPGIISKVAGAEGVEPPVAVLSQKYLAGREGVEPPTEVLETSVMPFNYRPIKNLLRTSGSRTSNFDEIEKMVLGETASSPVKQANSAPSVPLTDTPRPPNYILF